MPDVKKTRIAILPHFSFETVVATFFDKSKFDIIPIDTTYTGLMEKYGQELYGDWCSPLKIVVAFFERAAMEKNVDKFIGVSANLCSYPLVLGDLQKWIKKKVEYYPVTMNELSPSPNAVKALFRQLKNAIPGLTFPVFMRKVPTAFKRFLMASDMDHLYYKHLPLVKNPKHFRTVYEKMKRELIVQDTLVASENVVKQWKEIVKSNIVRESPVHRILITGDISIMSMHFFLFDIDVFLALHGVEVVQPSGSYYLDPFSKFAKQARSIISQSISNKYNTLRVSQNHFIEVTTLYRILKSLDEKIDGIVFIRPIMCAPCNNLSFILKKENYFGLPMVEISYDEHTGLNGIITRLEAFLNIIVERKREI